MGDNEGGIFSRRRALGLGAVAAGTGLAVAACSSSHSTGNAIGQRVGTINDLTVQQGRLTTAAYNNVEGVLDCQYPDALLGDSLELRNLRKKLLLFNKPDMLGYIHCFSAGTLVAVFPVSGKVSSTQSSMTSSYGVYTNNDSSTTEVPLAADDISWGPNEGGDAGVFWFTPEEVLVVMGGPIGWIYLNTIIPGAEGLLVYKDTMRPNAVAPAAKKGDSSTSQATPPTS